MAGLQHVFCYRRTLRIALLNVPLVLLQSLLKITQRFSNVDCVAFLAWYPVNDPLSWLLRDRILQSCTQGPFPGWSTMGDSDAERSQSFPNRFTHSTDIWNRHPCRHSGYFTMACHWPRVWTHLLVGHGPSVWKSLVVGHGPRVWRSLLVGHGPSVWGSLPVGHGPRVWSYLLFHPSYHTLDETLRVVIGPQHFLHMRRLEISSVYIPICEVRLYKVSFFLLWFSIWGRGTQLSRNVMGKKWNQIVGLKRIFCFLSCLNCLLSWDKNLINTASLSLSLAVGQHWPLINSLHHQALACTNPF